MTAAAASAAGAALPEGRLEQRFTDYKPLYRPAEAEAEANRCLYCVDAPCIQACPTEIDIPTFIRKIATGNVRGAARTILDANLLGYSCSRVCPVEVLCVGACVYNAWERPPIQIGRLQRYATETTLARGGIAGLYARRPATGKRVACVGGGPASIAAAGLLALAGHRVTVFERKQVPGGLNTLGIAPYKMLGDAALREVEWVLALGEIELRTGVTVGEGDLSAARLLADYDAVFLGLGLGADSTLGVPGEEGPGVHGAVALIERIKADPTFDLGGARTALVVGGGNTAIDIAHELALLDLEDVAMVYRRREADMSGYAHELDYARRHGVRLLEDRVPLAVLRDGQGRVTGLRVARAQGGKPVAGSEHDLPCDLIAVAIGQARATGLAQAFPGVALDPKGRVVVDPVTRRTGHPKVWAGGDCVNGGKEVVNAAQDAKLAARSIDALLRGA